MFRREKECPSHFAETKGYKCFYRTLPESRLLKNSSYTGKGDFIGEVAYELRLSTFLR